MALRRGARPHRARLGHLFNGWYPPVAFALGALGALTLVLGSAANPPIAIRLAAEAAPAPPLPPSPPAPPSTTAPPSAPARPSAVPGIGVIPPSTSPSTPRSAEPPAVPPPSPPAVPSSVPAVPPSVPAVPAIPAPLPSPPAPVSADCGASWGVPGAAGSALAVPVAAPGTDVCRPGAVRPAPAPGNCGKQVDAAGLETALASAAPGDRICVRGSSQSRLTIARSGTQAAPIQVIGTGTAVKGITVKADHVVVEGFDSADASAPSTQLTGDDITLRNNTVTRPKGGDGDGIRFFGTNLKILHNTVSEVRNAGGAHADCMQTFATNTPTSQHVLIHSNRCEKIDNQCLIAEGPHSSAGDGSGKGNSSDLTFTNNFCESHAAQAVMIDDVQDVTVTGNEITGYNRKAFAFDNKSTGAKVSGNKIATGIGYEVGMDNSSRQGYQGPAIGGAP